MSLNDPDVRVCDDLRDLSERAAAATATTIADAVRRHGQASVVLSGGSTPRPLYGVLASAYREAIAWRCVHLFWGDERYVPADDPASNYRMAREALLDHVPCPPENIHPMPTRLPSPDAAARAYEQTLLGYFNGKPPRFDLVLLGLGEDGHTASLFPGSPSLREQTRWVVATTSEAQPPIRLTLTLPALTAAAATCVLVSGSKKAAALRHVLGPAPDPNRYPAAGLRSTGGTLMWWVDRDAAGADAPPTA